MNENLFKTQEEITQLPEEDVLNYFLNLAPLSSLTVDQLHQEGWESIYSFRPYELNGAINRFNIQSALKAIGANGASFDSYWQLCSAKQSPEKESDPIERDHIYFVMKKHQEENPQQ